MIGGVLAYAALVVVLMVGTGVTVTPDVIAIGFGLAAILLGRGRLFLRDWLPFLVLLLAYELMRGLADDAGLPLHAEDLAGADRLLFGGALPTQVLQDALRPASGLDALAILATVVYMLHFALPLGTGFVLWVARRPLYYDFVAALILLSFAGFITYLLLPAAPPWYLADHGMLDGPDGLPVITYLKPDTFVAIAEFLGLDGRQRLSDGLRDREPQRRRRLPLAARGVPVPVVPRPAPRLRRGRLARVRVHRPGGLLRRLHRRPLGDRRGRRHGLRVRRLLRRRPRAGSPARLAPGARNGQSPCCGRGRSGMTESCGRVAALMERAPGVREPSPGLPAPRCEYDDNASRASRGGRFCWAAAR